MEVEEKLMSYDGEKENISEILEKVFDKFEKELI